MMNLIEKIKTIYPNLVEEDFMYNIVITDEVGGLRLVSWNHPTLARPTQEQLNSVEE